ncbi:MAG: L-seryl-tRNA(Sec) selenium transferase [Anaerolineales bacterium]
MSRRDLPSLDRLLSRPDAVRAEKSYGHPLLRSALRQALDNARSAIAGGAPTPANDQLMKAALDHLGTWLQPSLQPVVNATGVILHTNLGRAPLCTAARQAIEQTAAGYTTLEYDLADGQRGQRQEHVESLLMRLTGAEAAMVVNNNAAAVLLALAALSEGAETLISRSQLVEIGGGFRIPDVLQQSGAHLIEVGTTNRTHLTDYERAIGPETTVILRAHHSNFQLIGFTTEPDLTALAQLADRTDLQLVDDLGSGSLLDTAAFGLAHEPMVQESVQAGADLVTFSGDKLLGGPQAGLIVGRRAAVEHLRSHPLARAVRADKLCLAALTATLTEYLLDRAAETIPIWRMISAEPESLAERVDGWIDTLGFGQAAKGESTVGGGSLPGETLPTTLLRLTGRHPDRLAAALRAADPPLIARVENGAVVLDPRTVLPSQDPTVLTALRGAMTAVSAPSTVNEAE